MLTFLCRFSRRAGEDVATVIQDLDESGYVVTNLSENEMAKVHGRYLSEAIHILQRYIHELSDLNFRRDLAFETIFGR